MASRAPLLLLAALVAASACSNTLPTAMVQFPGAPPLQVDVAADPASRERGLMFRPGLAPDRGMLFVFPEEQAWGFWMKGVTFPIDILWISANGTVVSVQSAPPCVADPCPVFEPAAPALYVVEAPAGYAANHSIGPGTAVSIPSGLRGR